MKAHIQYFFLYSFLSLQHTIPIVSLPIISWFPNFYRVWAILEFCIKSSHVVNENFNEHVLGKWKTDGLPVCMSFISFVNSESTSHVYSILFITIHLHRFYKSFLNWSIFINSNSLNIVFIDSSFIVFFPSYHCNSFLTSVISLFSPDFSKWKTILIWSL